MYAKLLNIALLLTSLMSYMEWGLQQHAFLFQIEWDLLEKLLQEPMQVVHPMTLIPLTGQPVLMVTLFQRRPSRYLTFIGMGAIGIIVWLITWIGLIKLNIWMVVSTLPYIVVCMLTLRYYRIKPGSRQN